MKAATALRYAPAGGPSGGESVFTYRTFAWIPTQRGADRTSILDPMEAWCEERFAQGATGNAFYVVPFQRRPGPAHTRSSSEGT